MSTVGARTALNLSGTMLGYYPLRVLPSKTAIAPVNPTFLPRVKFRLRDAYCMTWSFLSFLFYLTNDAVFLSLKMKERCALEQFIAQISTRRYFEILTFLESVLEELLAVFPYLFCSYWIFIILIIFLLLLQLTQADVKNFFESICGEVCSSSLNWASSFHCLLNSTILWDVFCCFGLFIEVRCLTVSF
jgi:hypothetical protein